MEALLALGIEAGGQVAAVESLRLAQSPLDVPHVAVLHAPRVTTEASS